MTHSSRLSALCDGIIEAGWLAAVVLTPLFFNIYSSRVFEPDKITLLRSIALIMIAAWSVRMLEERAASTKFGGNATDDANGRRSIFGGVNLRTPLILPTLLLVAVYLIATVLSITPRTSLLGSYQRLQGTYTTLSYIVVFLMIVQHMRRRRQLDRLVTTIVITSLPIAFYGVLQSVDRDPLPWGGDVRERVAANMGNAIFIAAYLIMAFFLTLGRVIEAFRVILTEEESRISDILRASAYIFVGAVQMIAFAYARSRGPLLGWLPGMFILGLVGLILLRVTLHRAKAPVSSEISPATARPAFADPPAQATLLGAMAAPIGGAGHDAGAPPSNLLSGIDVVYALGLFANCVLAAALFGGLVYIVFRDWRGEPYVELAAVAALIGGLVPLLVAVGFRRAAARWVWASWIFFLIIGAAGLLAINFSDHPWIVEQRAAGTFGQLANLFESEGGTGKVRTLIWEGAVQLVLPHDPIRFPEGGQDNLNGPLRWLFGYGPESMYVAYNRFYPPDLAHYEARNASPDRSHNETWDSFVITGAAGFLAEQFLFLSAFYFALKFIGWVPNRKAAITLVAMMILGGAAGAIGLLIVKGVNFMGTGWPGGVAVGLVLYVVYFALFHFQISGRVYALIASVLLFIANVTVLFARYTSDSRIQEMLFATGVGIVLLGGLYFVGRRAFDETAGQPIAVSGHIFIIIALFGGILAHYLEISLAGIAIVSTRTYFWTFAALLVVTGLNWVPADDAETAPAARPALAPPITPKAPLANVPRHKKRRATAPVSPRPEPRPSISRAPQAWRGPTIALALITALILITLGFNFVNAPPVGASACAPQTQPTSATQMLSDSLTRLSYKNEVEKCDSPGVLLMFLITWQFGAVASLTELRRRNIVTPGNQLAATFTYLGVSIGVAFTYWLLHAGGLIGTMNLLVQLNPGTATSVNEFVQRFINVAESMAGLLGLFYLAVIGIIVFAGLSLISETRARLPLFAGEWSAMTAAPIFGMALWLLLATNFSAIRADIVFKQGQPYIANNACNGAGNPLGQCDIAIAHLKQALAHAPDEDFYMLALGASYLNKSAAAADGPPEFVEGQSYESILRQSAESTAVLNRRDALTAAQVTLEHARQINPLNTDHSANLARLHRRWADLAADDAERKQRLDEAGAYYDEATMLSPHNAQLWNEWAIVYFGVHELATRLGDSALAATALDQAEVKLDESLRLDPLFADTYLYLHSLYTARGQADQAQQALIEAQRLSPDNPDVWGRLTEQLLAEENFAEAERITLDFVTRNPGFLPAWRTLSQRIYYPQGRLAEAIDAARRSVELSASDPEHWADLLWLAQTLGAAGNLAEALTHAQEALAAAPPERKAEVQQVIDSIQAALSGTPPPLSP